MGGKEHGEIIEGFHSRYGMRLPIVTLCISLRKMAFDGLNFLDRLDKGKSAIDLMANNLIRSFACSLIFFIYRHYIS
jgi:hypothetical protein